MNILIVSQYFWPENMRINDLAIGFRERGHYVTVLTGYPNYPEGTIYEDFRKSPQSFGNLQGVDIVRVPTLPRGQSKLQLALNYLVFFLSASIFGPLILRGRRFDVVFIYGVSPISVAIPGIILSKIKGARSFLWVLDLWPESVAAVGAVNKRWILSIVGLGVRWIYKNVHFILIQSRAFLTSVIKYSGSEKVDRILYFPSWAESLFHESLPKNSSNAEKTILFAGNVGEAQDFESVLKAMSLCQNRGLGLKLKIVGDGRGMPLVRRLVQEYALENVELCGRHPIEMMPKLYSEADALFLSLRPSDIFSLTIPGKLQSYLAAGRPIVAMIDGEAKRIIEESKAGLVAKAGDVDSLFAVLQQFSTLGTADLYLMSQAARKYYEDHFEREKLFMALESMFLKPSSP